MNDAINFNELHKQAELGNEKAWKALHYWYPVVGAYSKKWTPSSVVLDVGFDQVRSHLFNEKGEHREPTLDEYAEALKIYTDLAEKGCSKAIEILLKWYSAGIFVKQDYKKCVKILQSASQIDAWFYYSWFDLAFCYANGLGVKQDFKEAYDCLVLLGDDIPMETISELYCGAHPTFLYPYHFTINEEFLDYCRLEMHDGNAEVAFALYRYYSDKDKQFLLNMYTGNSGTRLCQAELGCAQLFGLYGLEKDEKSAFENLWEACADPDGAFKEEGLREDEINARLLLAECYDKGIGTNANPEACATVLSMLLFEDGEYYSDDPEITCLIEANYRDDIPKPRKTVLFGKATTLSEQQCGHYLFEKYKDEIEKRINADDAGRSLGEAFEYLPGPWEI